jgi:hypothetical protein
MTSNLIQLRPKDFMSKEAIYLNAKLLHSVDYFKKFPPLSQSDLQRAIEYLLIIEENNGGVIFSSLMQAMCQILELKQNTPN